MLESDPKALGEAVKEAADIINSAQRPAVIAGMELIRYRFQNLLRDFLGKSGFPYATMMMGKTVLSEDHPQFIGLYEGDISRKAVKDRVHGADCIILLGELMTDFNTGGFTANLNQVRPSHLGNSLGRMCAFPPTSKR